MWRTREKAALPARSLLLAARPTPHPRAVERPLDSGAVELSVPMRRPRLARWLGNRPDSATRRFELDQLGTEVWKMMDGRTTVRQMIERFAEKHHLNLSEAEVAMLTYLRTLSGRGIMVLAMPDNSADDAGRGASMERENQ